MRGDRNFGDLLTPLILRHLGYTARYVSAKAHGKLMAVGTLLPLLRPGDVVWGTGGYLRPGVDRIRPPKGVEFLAVRGPMTRSIVEGEVPEIYGDPGLLLPAILPPAMEKTHEVGVIPHMVEKDVPPIQDPNVLWINITSGVPAVVEQVTRCHFIVSSCLHGIITAEAYGIPATWVRMSNRIRAGSFKYNDYYLSTGRDTREPMPWTGSLKGATKVAAPALQFDSEPLVQALHRRFPKSPTSPSHSPG